MEEGKWSGITKHMLLDFMQVAAKYRTATLLAGLEVIINILLGVMIDKGLNINVLIPFPMPLHYHPLTDVIRVPKAHIIPLYNSIFDHLMSSRGRPPVTKQEAWSDLLGNPAAYLEEVYKLSMTYTITIF